MWVFTFNSTLINLFLNSHPYENQLSLNLPVIFHICTQTGVFFLYCALYPKLHLPGPELPSAVHTPHCTQHSARSMCGGCLSGVSRLIKTSCNPVAVSSSESLLGFHVHSWMFLGLPVRDCCDMGTGDETGLLRHTNIALHSRPCVQLVGMTQEAQGFIESC